MIVVILINKISVIICSTDFKASGCTSLLQVKNTYHYKIKNKNNDVLGLPCKKYNPRVATDR